MSEPEICGDLGTTLTGCQEGIVQSCWNIPLETESIMNMEHGERAEGFLEECGLEWNNQQWLLGNGKLCERQSC